MNDTHGFDSQVPACTVCTSGSGLSFSPFHQKDRRGSVDSKLDRVLVSVSRSRQLVVFHIWFDEIAESFYS